MRTLYHLLIAACLVAPLLPGEAGAQSSRDILNRINRLETEIDTLNRALYRGETPPPPSLGSGGNSSADAAQTEVRLQQLEGEIRALTGRVEEVSHQVRQVEETLNKLSSDLELRLLDLEGGRSGTAGGGAFAPQTAPQANAPAYTTLGQDYPSEATRASAASGQNYEFSTNNLQNESFVAADRNAPAEGFSAAPLGTLAQRGAAVDDAAGLYENAFSLLKNANYQAAEQQFTDFLSRYPDHVLAGNAKYWLGETYYVRGNYQEAARVFAEGYQKYPQSTKAADNLLKLGLSLEAAGNKTDACVAMRQLQQDYPTGSGPVLRRAEQEMAKLGC